MSITLRGEVLKKYLNPLFLETGTFKGGGVRLALDCGFPRVVSIEVDPVLHGTAEKMFKDLRNVDIIKGDSLAVLPKLLESIKFPITFWLDAHIQESAVIGEVPVPLIQELEIISKCRSGMPYDTVMIDDRRLFGKGQYWRSVTEERIISILKGAYPYNTIYYEDSNAGAQDILVSAYKPQSLEEFIQTNQDNAVYQIPDVV